MKLDKSEQTLISLFCDYIQFGPLSSCDFLNEKSQDFSAERYSYDAAQEEFFYDDSGEIYFYNCFNEKMIYVD